MRKFKDNISDMLLQQLETDPTYTKSWWLSGEEHKHCRQINWHITTREPVTILTAFGKHQEFQERREHRLRLQTVAHGEFSTTCTSWCCFKSMAVLKKKNKKTKEEDWERQSNVYSSEWISDLVFLKSYKEIKKKKKTISALQGLGSRLTRNKYLHILHWVCTLLY